FTLEEYKSVIADIGIVIIGQTAEIAPADKKMYALRDVTGTVECIPLIAGSIMSKKLAEGIDALVLDIKTGRGAFMQSESDAIELAKTLIAIGNNFGKKTIGFLTDMSQPLGYAVGNWLEVVECVECMRGKDVSDLMEVTYLLSGVMVMLGGKAKTIEEGVAKCKESIASGVVYKKFLQMVERQGGDPSFIEDLSKYPKSKYSLDVKSNSGGYINSIDALEVGFTGIMISAGRMKVDDVIDPKAGIIFNKKVNDPVNLNDTLAVIYGDDKPKLEAAARRLQDSFQITTKPSSLPPLIHAMIDEKGVHEWKKQ
ncbi:MAG: thymidine phosphorylase, partial [Candidatus Bathyarchaeota archaeon]